MCNNKLIELHKEGSESAPKLGPSLETRTSRASSSSRVQPCLQEEEALARLSWPYNLLFRYQNCELRSQQEKGHCLIQGEDSSQEHEIGVRESSQSFLFPSFVEVGSSSSLQFAREESLLRSLPLQQSSFLPFCPFSSFCWPVQFAVEEEEEELEQGALGTIHTSGVVVPAWDSIKESKSSNLFSSTIALSASVVTWF